MESRCTPKNSESNFRGQNSMAYDVLYIIGKILERKCLKWAHIAHLDIWNTSYGQKKGRESNCQFDSRPKKVGNRLDLLVWRGRAIYRWKAFNKSYNFTYIASRSEVFSQSYGAPKSRKSPLARFQDSHSGISREKSHLDVSSVANHRVNPLQGGRQQPLRGRGYWQELS
jgi:hypothetical protein